MYQGTEFLEHSRKFAMSRTGNHFLKSITDSQSKGGKKSMNS
jgi:hypothetical protein